MNMNNEKWGIIGVSSKIQEVLNTISKVASTDVAVLVQGESGTGKELVTQAIHNNSSRSDKDIITVNCGAIPEGILESELFGHEKGAFTGAHIKRLGYFELADKGTIFLDEIGEMTLLTQVKLLRVLESGEFMRVGGTKKIKTDVRVIAATNKDLSNEVDKGNFREDLYYRLKSVLITLPPLRERARDIPLLLEKFKILTEKKYNIYNSGFTLDAEDCLIKYNWPGNIRELKNFVESVLILKKEGMIDIDDLPENIRSINQNTKGLPIHLNKTTEQAERELIYGALLGLRSDIADLKEMMNSNINSVKDQGFINDIHNERDITEYLNKTNNIYEDDITMGKMEEDAIREALKRYRGNRKLAAHALGISERTLYRKLKKIV